MTQPATTPRPRADGATAPTPARPAVPPSDPGAIEYASWLRLLQRPTP